MSGEAGKGDTYRPVDRKKWEENFDRIFRDRKTVKPDESVKNPEPNKE